MSCLFRALAYFVRVDSPERLRQKICTYLALNRPLAHADAATYVRWETQMGLDHYVRLMRQPSTWGGAIELQAFCELYGWSVQCIDTRTQKSWVYAPLNNTARRHVTLLWQGASHYEPQRS